MTVISTDRDTENLTLTFVAEYDASPERVWQLWADPRQLERWWGPPTWPATFDEHQLRPGGRSAYYMTGPSGERSHGWWHIVTVDAPRRLEFDDGFADDDGRPHEGMPVTRTEVSLAPVGDGTRMTTLSRFASLEQLEQLIEMGMEEGMRQAMGQIDALLDED